MTLKTLAAAACISFAGATATIAAPVPVDFNFSFSDGTETITGLIEGLVSEGSNQAASAITITGVLDTYKLVDSDFFENNFTVNNGMIDLVRSVVSFGATKDGADGTAIIVHLGYNHPTGFTSLESPNTSDRLNNPDVLIKGATGSFTPVSAVPLPAGGLLLLSGIGGVAALKRRKKRAA